MPIYVARFEHKCNSNGQMPRIISWYADVSYWALEGVGPDGLKIEFCPFCGEKLTDPRSVTGVSEDVRGNGVRFSDRRG